ncbi:MAG: glycosyltransferase family 2 protein, partial [Synechococcaceae cyanobacterium]|nr:glycosyltransferase family 2 protein [Synechococcaceae cyanobacterium]
VCAGTSFLVRRAALEEIGGFVEAAISEDLATGMALAARGWELRYLHEKLSAGLAAETMLDFVRQRQRWAAGTLQTLRLPQGPLRLRGLRLGQRLAYLEGTLHWFDPLPRLVLLLLPLSVGLLGVPPFRFNGEAISSLLLPLWLTLLLSLGWFNQRSRHALAADLPSWAQAVPLAATVLASLAGRFQPFRITPKHRLSTRGGIAAALAVPLLVLLLLHGWNLALIGRVISAGAGAGSEWMGAFWGLITLLGLLLALRACWDPPRPDPSPWLALRLPARLRALGTAGQLIEREVEVVALSETGVQLAGPEGLPGGSRPLSLELHPGTTDGTTDGTAALPPLPPPLPLSAERPSPGRLLWDRRDAVALRSLQLWLYSRPGAWPKRQALAEWRTLLALLRSLLTPPWAAAPERLSLVPQQLAAGRSVAGDRSGRSSASAS